MLIWSLLAGFTLTLVLSLLFTPLVALAARRWGVIDQPGPSRKIHSRPIPLLGGLAIGLSFFVGLLVVWRYWPELLLGQNLRPQQLLAMIGAGGIVLLGGMLDDIFDLKPSRQIIFPILAAIVVIAGGVGVQKITNPLGGYWQLNTWQIVLWAGLPYTFTVLADSLSFTWLLGMMYTTKFLDGLDGLVSGLSAIGALLIMLFSTMTQWWQPDIALLSAILAGALSGFLIFNWHPAKIFLGEGGSLFCGLMLGLLAIIAGGKIAVALLVMGLPILDVVWVIARRLIWEKRSPFRTADRKHLHFRLFDLGLSQRQTVGLFYAVALLFGSTALFLQSRGKIIALAILAVLMVLLAGFLVWKLPARPGGE